MILSVIFNHLNDLNLKDLKGIMRRKKFKGYSRMKKTEIVDFLKRYYSSLAIQKFYKNKKSLNKICPISLENVRFPHWSTKTEKGWIMYNLKDLAEYLVSRGDFRDPSTRIYFNDNDIVSMNKLVSANRIKLKRNLVRSFRNSATYYKRKRENDEQVDIVQERIRHVICIIRDHIEEIQNGYLDIKEFTNQLYINYFPSIIDYIMILKRINRNSVNYSFVNCENLIKNISSTSQVSKHLKKTVLEWLEYNKSKHVRSN